MKQLKKYAKILDFLYRDEVKYIEEISVIEKMYLSPQIKIFVDSVNDITCFLIIQKRDSYNINVFLDSKDSREFTARTAVMLESFIKCHVQTGDMERDLLKDLCSVHSEYRYQIMESDKKRSVEESSAEAFPQDILRITPQTHIKLLNQLSGGEGELLREEARHGFLFVKMIDGDWAAQAGTCNRSRNYDYLFVETHRDHRGKGYAREVLSLAVNEAYKRNKKPLYALDTANIPSLKLAEKLGFTPSVNRRCLFIGEWQVDRTEKDSPLIPDSSFTV